MCGFEVGDVREIGMPNGCMLAFWVAYEVECGGVDIARGGCVQEGTYFVLFGVWRAVGGKTVVACRSAVFLWF